MPRKKQEMPEAMLPTEDYIEPVQEDTEENDLTEAPEWSSPPESSEDSAYPADDGEPEALPEDESSFPDATLDEAPELTEPEAAELSEAAPTLTNPQQPSPGGRPRKSILTIAAGDEAETPEGREETAWHGIRNAYHTRRILTGVLSGTEETENGKLIAVVNYNNFRVVIPASEVLLNPVSEGEYGVLIKNRIIGKMIGAEIDFVIRGIETKSRSIVASRKEAMLRKRKVFYFNRDELGKYRINENDIIQARIISVEDKSLRIEAFGVEHKIRARDLSYDWLGDVRDHYNVGDTTLIRIQKIFRESPENLGIEADVKSVSGEQNLNDLDKCRPQGKYAGVVTDVYRGVVFIHLHIGVNAVAHSCYDERMPIRKDEVSLVVTHLDRERNVAVGIINRIMRRRL